MHLNSFPKKYMHISCNIVQEHRAYTLTNMTAKTSGIHTVSYKKSNFKDITRREKLRVNTTLSHGAMGSIGCNSLNAKVAII